MSKITAANGIEVCVCVQARRKQVKSGEAISDILKIECV